MAVSQEMTQPLPEELLPENLPDLDKVWKERQDKAEFRFRDTAYKVFENTVLARSPDGGQQNLTFRPIMLDNQPTADSDNQLAINICRQVVRHHMAMFSRPPRIWNVPYNPDALVQAGKNTQWVRSVFKRSRLKSSQPRNSYWLSARGEFPIGVEWDEHRREIMVRSYDPAWCYPSFNDQDWGGLDDILITFEVPRQWASSAYKIKVDEGKPTVRTYIYWDSTRRLVQVGDQKIVRLNTLHNLGFVPWRWCFGDPNGHLAQADIADIPRLQEMINDLLVLGLDAMRRTIDKAYWGKGIKGNVSPQPGKVIGFPNPAAEIHEFPTAAPPQMITSFMGVIQGYAQAMAGISPISMEGLAEGSIVTGSAVRHQVEAIEARAETKRTMLEETFAILGEYVLRVTALKFPDVPMLYQNAQGTIDKMVGSEIRDWYSCEAAYGGFEALSPLERGRWAMEGLGRIHGLRKAVEIAYPDDDPETMTREVEQYQLSQAALTGRSQAVAAAASQQQAAQGGSPQPTPSGGPTPPGAPQPGAPPSAGEPPQRPGQPPDPGQALAQQRVKLGDLKLMVDVVRSQLHGEVYAMGEIALAGQAVKPLVAATDERDVGLLNSVFANKAQVTVGVQPDQPKAKL